jgi:MFS family permease
LAESYFRDYLKEAHAPHKKPYLVYSMALIAIGVGGIGLAGSFEQLYLCRLFTGLGVAGLSTAATMSVTDMSTPLNRASTFAPIMSAFAAGTALGPALGGILSDQIGINPTFYLVGVSYIGLAGVNNILLDETQPKPMKFPWQRESSSNKEEVSIRESFENALGQWIPLLSRAQIRNVCAMNGFYWMALAGSQMTLLPLILTDPGGLAMTATNVGQVYMGMSLVQVLGNPILAKFVDKIGKIPGIVGGCTLISIAMGSLPFCTDLYQMAGVLGLWATGSTLLSTAPISYISDKVDDKQRAQAIALLRTTGDVGFLVGASSMGALADWAGSLDVALQSSAGILFTATALFAARNILSAQLATEKKYHS